MKRAAASTLGLAPPTLWALNAPHCLPVPNCADAGTLSMRAMLRLALVQWLY